MNRLEFPRNLRMWISRGFAMVEDVVYVGLGLLLAASALTLLVSSTMQIAEHISGGTLSEYVVKLLDQILLILLIVELLYTVQVSFREHMIVPGPFLLVGLIAAVRRVLVLTAEFGEGQDKTDAELTWFLIELGVFTVLILALVASIRLITSKHGASRPERA
jgi:uncharacterized membrane protein (DUF373 family)